MDIELRHHLRAFAAVATLGSFTATSRELLITQPALTRTVQQLENALGVRLLDRNSRAMDPTDVGRKFLERALGVLNDVDRAVLGVRGRPELRAAFPMAAAGPVGDGDDRGVPEGQRATATLLRRDYWATTPHRRHRK